MIREFSTLFSKDLWKTSSPDFSKRKVFHSLLKSLLINVKDEKSENPVDFSPKPLGKLQTERGTRLLEREAQSSKLLGKNFKKIHWCSFLLKVQHGVTCSAFFQFLLLLLFSFYGAIYMGFDRKM